MAESLEPVMTIERIMEILPHRYPFLLVDRVIERQGGDGDQRVGRKVKCVKNVTFNEPFFPGHFPHRPVMPGVLLVEAMAQAGALACFSDDDPPMDVAIANIREAKFRRPVVPGDTLILTSEVKKDKGAMILIECQAHVEGRLAAQAEILAYVTPKKTSAH